MFQKNKTNFIQAGKIMKDVVVIYKEMGTGGIESSLFHFINEFKEEVNLKLVTWLKGPRDNEVVVPHDVLNCSISKSLQVIDKNKTDIKKEPLNLRLKWLFYKFLMKLKIFDRYVTKKFKTKKPYVADVGICFAPWEISLRLYKKIFRCKYNICLIHGDVRSVDLSAFKKLLNIYDKIVCVSASCAEVFKQVLPELKDKVDYIYNFQNEQKIINGAEEFSVNYEPSDLNLVSVSRLSEEKAHVRFLKVLNQIIKEGFNVRYTIVGDGPERQNIEEYIIKNKMEDVVKLVGNKPNPYPYIKAADLFLLGSYHEAAPMVYAESMLLGVPVLTTKTCSAEELVGEKGFVCENTEEGIYNALKHILTNKQELNNRKGIIKDYSYPNGQIKQKWLDFINKA